MIERTDLEVLSLPNYFDSNNGNVVIYGNCHDQSLWMLQLALDRRGWEASIRYRSDDQYRILRTLTSADVLIVVNLEEPYPEVKEIIDFSTFNFLPIFSYKHSLELENQWELESGDLYDVDRTGNFKKSSGFRDYLFHKHQSYFDNNTGSVALICSLEALFQPYKALTERNWKVLFVEPPTNPEEAKLAFAKVHEADAVVFLSSAESLQDLSPQLSAWVKYIEVPVFSFNGHSESFHLQSSLPRYEPQALEMFLEQNSDYKCFAGGGAL